MVHRSRVKKKVNRLGECNKKKKKSARREVARESLRRMTDGGPVVPDPTDMELKVLVIGSDCVDGFDGWMGTGIAWRYDWHQRTINQTCMWSNIITPWTSMKKQWVVCIKNLISSLLIYVDIYEKTMWLFVLKI